MMNGELEYRRGNDMAFEHLRLGRAGVPCPMTSLGAGCSRPATHWARFSWSKDISRRRRRSTALISASTTLSRACQHPNNLWSLHGLHECLTRRGAVQATLIKQQLDLALARAEVEIHASCYCRQKRAA